MVLCSGSSIVRYLFYAVVISISFSSLMNPRSMMRHLFKICHITENKHLNRTPCSNMSSISKLSMSTLPSETIRLTPLFQRNNLVNRQSALSEQRCVRKNSSMVPHQNIGFSSNCYPCCIREFYRQSRGVPINIMDQSNHYPTR
jgi:hypothetical protein